MKNSFLDFLGQDTQTDISPRARKRRPLGTLTLLVNTFEFLSVKQKLSKAPFRKMPDFFDRHDSTDEFDCDDDNDTTLNDDDLLLSPTAKLKPASIYRAHLLLENQLELLQPSGNPDLKDHLYSQQFDSCSSLLELSGVNTFAVSNDLIPRIDELELKKIIDGEYAELFDEHIIIDCRFPYEYEGGHIANAINIALQSDLEERFVVNEPHNLRRLLVFHCEYSIFRGPTMASHLRKIDRIYNSDRYPYLLYPDIVVLEGGYKKFYDKFRLHCVPQAYVEMKDTKHKRTCEVEMSKVLQASKLTRAKSFNQFQPRLAVPHARLSSFTQLLSLLENLTFGPTGASRKNSRTLKIHKKERSTHRASQFTQLLMSLPDTARPDCQRLDLPVSLAFEDDFAPPPTLFRKHSKSLSSSLILVHLSLLLVCLESFSAFSLSDSLLELCSPFADYDYFDGAANSGNFAANLSSYSFPGTTASAMSISANSGGNVSGYSNANSGFTSTPFSTPFGNSTPFNSKNKARLTLARPNRASQHLLISSPTVSSPLTGVPSSTFESTNSTSTIAMDVINDSEVEFSLPKHSFRKDSLGFAQRDTSDIDEADEESD